MRIGISLSSTSRLEPRRAAEHLLARVRAARDAGLDTLTFGDSHTRTDALYFQNTPTLGRALAEWDPERAAGCLFLLPMWNPVLVAEHIGTLATFHPRPIHRADRPRAPRPVRPVRCRRRPSRAGARRVDPGRAGVARRGDRQQ